MNDRSSLPTTAILREAKQLAALTSFVRDEFGGCAIESRESELVGLADDLATGIYDYFRNSPTSGQAGAVYGASGKVAAVVTSIAHAIASAPLAADDEARDALAARIGWLQLSASEIAEDLACHLEQLCAEGGAA